MDGVTTIDTAAVAKPDGRRLRGERTRAKLLAACRAEMRRGNFRPPAARVAEIAGKSVRSVFEQFGDLNRLHQIAMAEEATFEAIVARVLPPEIATLLSLGQRARLVMALVAGKVEGV